MAGDERRLSRRGFLAAGGAALLGAVVAGSAGLAAPGPDSGLLTDFWLFGRYADGCTDAGFDEAGLDPVQLPHCVAPLSWTGWDPASWQDRWIYRKHFTATTAGRYRARFDGVMTNAAVYLNGTLVASHEGGYLPFEVELPGVAEGDNTLAVVVDGRWALDVPPNLPGASPAVLDFYQPAGIYRPATIGTVPRTRITDVFACPVDVLSLGRSLHVRCELERAVPAQVTASVRQAGRELARGSASMPAGGTAVELDVRGLDGVRLWDVADPARPTSGALASTTGARYAGGDVEILAYNDYTARRGAPFRLRPPRPGVPYLVTEAIGTLAGVRAYRRTDPPATRQLQAELHAKAHDLAAADDRYCGLLAWCAFDYPSGWQRSVGGSKFAGVADIFRIAKPAAAFYASQGPPDVRAVAEPGFDWDFTAQPAGPGRGATIWSNCDRLAVFLDDRPVGDARSRRADFPHLPHPPFAVDLVVPRGQRPQLRIDGYAGGRLVVSRRFSGDRSRDVLGCTPDDPSLRADGGDATRVVIAATDRFGTVRAGTTGAVSVALAGPGELIGDAKLDFGATGGAAAVWVRPFAGPPGTLVLTARHDTLGTATATITTTATGKTAGTGS
ncbi:sugar-binding domain-containing protein [Amycolatopsis sp. NPDC049159]|uniref:sugar-binding domain-containing protein n=1 Tax=Amycolatopsis sp. NPDC049159 TaxID=3157210 RepID=UPI0033CF3048